MRYEAGALTTLTTATALAPLAALRAPATEQCRLREFGVTLTAATLSRFGLQRATVVSATPSGLVVGQPKVPGAPVGLSELVTAWVTPPTVGAVGTVLRRISLPAAIGAGFVWTWPADDPLIVGNGAAISELVLVNLVAVACSLAEIYAVWED